MSNTTPYTIPARPTTYKGVEMRSRLEARFAELLDRWGIEWDYEPRCYADETGQYLPDFVTHGWWLPRTQSHPGGMLKLPVFVETKPLALYTPDVSQRMLRIRASEPNSVLMVWTPETIGFPLYPPVIGGTARCVFCSRIFLRQINHRPFEDDSCRPDCVIERSLVTVNSGGEWWRTQDGHGYELFQEYR